MKLAPMLSVRKGKDALAFYAAAFGTAATVHAEDGDGRVVAELHAGDVHFWVADESPENGNFAPPSIGGSGARMILSVDDPDSVIDNAVAAGATLIWPVADRYGLRLGRVEDPFGHHWEIGRLLPRP